MYVIKSDIDYKLQAKGKRISVNKILIKIIMLHLRSVNIKIPIVKYIVPICL